jgi:hypothetical protein
MFATETKNRVVDFVPAAPICIAKSVRFQAHCDGRYIPYPSPEEAEKRWYSESQQRFFKSKMKRDAMKCSILLERGVGTEATKSQEFALRCVGLSHLISHDVSKRWDDIKEARRYHVKIVLEEQDRQRSTNINSPEHIARVSSRNSALSRKKSQVMAKLVAPV